MDIVCEHCKSRFKVPDEKLPSGKIASFPCPKCKEKITVEAGPKPDMTRDDGPSADEGDTDAYDASDKPFDFVEEEGKTALICASDPAIKQGVMTALENLEYQMTDAEDTAAALKKMRYHVYDVVLVEESFDTDDQDANEVLGYLERLNTAIRRNMFVVLISRTHQTMDKMQAFVKSVDMVLNVKNIGEFEKVLNRNMTDHDFFYHVFRETLKKIGRA